MKTMPTRTIEPATPCAPSLAPNSSAANATVWLKSGVAEAGDDLRRRPAARGRARRARRAAAAAPTTAGGRREGRWVGGRSRPRRVGQSEDPAEPRDVQPVRRRLGDRAVPVWPDGPLVRPERPLVLDEPSRPRSGLRGPGRIAGSSSRGSASTPDQRASSRGIRPSILTGWVRSPCARPVPLAGTVTVGGAKNSVLKLMAATILAEGEYELTNVPGIVDVELMRELLTAIGVRSERDAERPPNAAPDQPGGAGARWRRPIWCGGCGLPPRCWARSWPAAVEPASALPGGDDFGSRPIDMHLKGLEALGARFTVRADAARRGGRRRAAGQRTSSSTSRASAPPRT